MVCKKCERETDENCKSCPVYKQLEKEYNCVRRKMRDKKGNEFYVLYDKSRELLFSASMTVEFAIKGCGFEFIEESEVQDE